MTTQQRNTGDLVDDARGRWWGPDFCPHVGNPVIDGCYFCGRSIPNPANGEHNHTMYEKKGFRGAAQDNYSCVCDSC